MIVIIINIALSAWIGWAVFTAPEGYQDADGFHYGEPDQ